MKQKKRKDPIELLLEAIVDTIVEEVKEKSNQFMNSFEKKKNDSSIDLKKPYNEKIKKNKATTFTNTSEEDIRFKNAKNITNKNATSHGKKNERY